MHSANMSVMKLSKIKCLLSVVVCIDLSVKEPHTQLGVGRVVTSGTQCGEMIRTLAQKVRDLGTIPALGATFRIYITAHYTGSREYYPITTMHCMVVEPTLCTHM